MDPTLVPGTHFESQFQICVYEHAILRIYISFFPNNLYYSKTPNLYYKLFFCHSLFEITSASLFFSYFLLNKVVITQRFRSYIIFFVLSLSYCSVWFVVGLL